MVFDLSNLDNNYIIAFSAVFLTAYIYVASKVQLPKGYMELYNNAIFRVAFLILLATINYGKAYHVAITLAFVYTLSILYLHEYNTNENFAYLKAYQNILSRKEEV
jgi:hypothetical protein